MSIFGNYPLGAFEDLEVDTCPKGQQNMGGMCVPFDMLSLCPGGEDLDLETGQCITNTSVPAEQTKIIRMAMPALPLATKSISPTMQLISRSPMPEGGAGVRLTASAALPDLSMSGAVPWILGGLVLGIVAVKLFAPKKKGVQQNRKRRIRRNAPGWPKWMRDKEREELRELLLWRGYSPAKAARYARLLEAEGMGPDELEGRLRIPSGEIGSLAYTHGYTKNPRRKARKRPAKKRTRKTTCKTTSRRKPVRRKAKSPKKRHRYLGPILDLTKEPPLPRPYNEIYGPLPDYVERLPGGKSRAVWADGHSETWTIGQESAKLTRNGRKHARRRSVRKTTKSTIQRRKPKQSQRRKLGIPDREYVSGGVTKSVWRRGNRIVVEYTRKPTRPRKVDPETLEIYKRMSKIKVPEPKIYRRVDEIEIDPTIDLERLGVRRGPRGIW